MFLGAAPTQSTPLWLVIALAVIFVPLLVWLLIVRRRLKR
jgi:hypothetical protein